MIATLHLYFVGPHQKLIVHRKFFCTLAPFHMLWQKFLAFFTCCAESFREPTK